MADRILRNVPPDGAGAEPADFRFNWAALDLRGAPGPDGTPGLQRLQSFAPGDRLLIGDVSATAGDGEPIALYYAEIGDLSTFFGGGGGNGGGGVSTFTALTDTPANFSGGANRPLRVNGAATAIEFGVVGQFVPAGGATGQALTKAGGGDYDTQWADLPGLPSSGIAGQPLVSNGAGGSAWLVGNFENPLRLGAVRLWRDGAGELRTKDGSDPIAHDDGAVIGTGAGGGAITPSGPQLTGGSHTLTAEQQSHLGVILHAASSSAITVPRSIAISAAKRAWLVWIAEPALTLTVKVEDDAGSVNGVAEATVTLPQRRGALVRIVVETNAGTAPSVWVDPTTQASIPDGPVSAAELRGYRETVASASVSGSITRSFAAGNVHHLTQTGNVTSVTIEDVPAGGAATITFILQQDGTGGRSWSNPSGTVVIGEGGAFNTDVDAVNILTYITTDGGSTWYRFFGGAQAA